MLSAWPEYGQIVMAHSHFVYRELAGSLHQLKWQVERIVKLTSCREAIASRSEAVVKGCRGGLVLLLASSMTNRVAACNFTESVCNNVHGGISYID